MSLIVNLTSPEMFLVEKVSIVSLTLLMLEACYGQAIQKDPRCLLHRLNNLINSFPTLSHLASHLVKPKDSLHLKLLVLFKTN